MIPILINVGIGAACLSLVVVFVFGAMKVGKARQNRRQGNDAVNEAGVETGHDEGNGSIPASPFAAETSESNYYYERGNNYEDSMSTFS